MLSPAAPAHPARLLGGLALLGRHLRVFRRRALTSLLADLAAPAACLVGLALATVHPRGLAGELAAGLVILAAGLAAGLEASLGGHRRLVSGPLPELVLSTPLGLGELLLAELLYTGLRAGLCALGTALLASALGLLARPAAAWAVGVGLLAGLAMGALGALAACLSSGPRGPRVFLAGVLLPCLALSGAFFPLERLPDWAELLARLNPLTHALDALEPGLPAWQLGLHLAVLALFALAPLLLAERALRRRLEA